MAVFVMPKRGRPTGLEGFVLPDYDHSSLFNAWVKDVEENGTVVYTNCETGHRTSTCPPRGDHVLSRMDYQCEKRRLQDFGRPLGLFKMPRSGRRAPVLGASRIEVVAVVDAPFCCCR